MKRRTLHYLLILAMVGVGLAGCRSDVKLNDVSVDSTLRAKFGLPIGEISVSLDTIVGLVGLGDEAKITKIEDSNYGDSTWLLTIDRHYDNEFHKIELTDYTGTVEDDKPVSQVMPGATMIPAQTKETVTFNMDINFNGVNDDTSDERIDSMVIDRASFTTTVTNNFGLQKEDIDRVEMVLGPQFRRAKGTRHDLPNFDFDKPIDIELDEFTLVMMKDETKTPANDNVVNKANIQFVVYLNYKPNGNNNPLDPGFEYLPLAPTSSFHFSFEVKMMEYKALYGYFEPGDETDDIDSVDVPLELPGNEPVILAAKNPKIVLGFTYGMSMPLAVKVNYIKAMHSDGTETFATWNGSTNYRHNLVEVLPIDAPLDATVYDDKLWLSKEVDHGTIDRFFLKEVRKLGYDYKLDVDRNKMNDLPMPQFRMTQNTKFSLNFHFEMPFHFNKGMSAGYSEDMTNIEFSRASLDSLAALVPGGIVRSIDSASVTLYLIATNEIPVPLKLDAVFLDKDSLPMTDLVPDLQNKDIKAANIAGSEPTVTPIQVPVKTEDFDRLSQATALRLKIRLGSEDQETRFVSGKKVSIKAGLTADIQAVLNLSLGQQNNK